jgi:hypothetical protein
MINKRIRILEAMEIAILQAIPRRSMQLAPFGGNFFENGRMMTYLYHVLRNYARYYIT